MPSTTRVKSYYIQRGKDFTQGHTPTFVLKTDIRFSSEPNSVLIYVGFLKSSHTAYM